MVEAIRGALATLQDRLSRLHQPVPHYRIVYALHQPVPRYRIVYCMSMTSARAPRVLGTKIETPKNIQG